MKSIVIADEDTVLGFSLAGVQGIIVNTEEETHKAFEEITHQYGNPARLPCGPNRIASLSAS